MKNRGNKTTSMLFPAFLMLAFFFVSARTAGQSRVRDLTFKVEETFNHDVNAYTQGLFIYEGALYESTGQYGSSSFRQVELKSGKVLSNTSFDKKYFIEGSCMADGRLYILTWMENVCFVYDLKTMNKLGEFRNPREGWGITSDGRSLIMSDGSPKLYFLDPLTFFEKRSITVKINGKELPSLNELEYINGEIWANVYGTDYIVMINPQNGEVTGRLDCRGLLPKSLVKRDTDVLNGIAWDSKNNYIYLTGKLWPKLYRISLIDKKIK